ncbi:hypothetical protein ACERII_09175 [Evansella sp. AB-rgal1]|uniref:hypothetical protein n=1 Tax=Evansella sp. AB-rgal1 TaxID=3242696 RepID=UPI00359D1AAD
MNKDFEKFLAKTRKPTMERSKKEEIRKSIQRYQSMEEEDKKDRYTNLKRVIAGFSGLAAVFLFAFLIIFDDENFPITTGSSLTPEGLQIEATIKPNRNEEMSHKDYMLEVIIKKDGNGGNMIYPVLEGLSNMSWAEREEGFFSPGSIGTNTLDEESIRDTLIESEVMGVDRIKDISQLMGFYIPEEAGEYRVRMYFEDTGFFNSGNQYLVYVHKEEKRFGHEERWTKLVEVNTEIPSTTAILEDAELHDGNVTLQLTFAEKIEDGSQPNGFYLEKDSVTSALSIIEEVPVYLINYSDWSEINYIKANWEEVIERTKEEGMIFLEIYEKDQKEVLFMKEIYLP